jgi:hypothetical protein
MECEFCKTTLKSLSSLNYHKKTNKKCLEKQNIILTDKFIPCEFCNKRFSNQTLKIHLLSCKNKKETEKDKLIENMKKEKDDIIKEKDQIIKEKNQIIEEKKQIIEDMNEEKEQIIEDMNEEKEQIIKEKDLLKEEILFLQNRILELEVENKIYLKDHDLVKNLAFQPKTTTTNNNHNNNNNKIKVMNNFFDNPEKVKQLVDEKLTQDHICDGQKGVAQFAINFLLKDDEGNMNYFCTDPSRSIFKFQNSDGETEKDIKAMKLTNMLLDAGIKHKTGTIAPTLWTKKDGTVDADKFQIFSPSTNEIIFMQSDNSVFRNELACFTSV